MSSKGQTRKTSSAIEACPFVSPRTDIQRVLIRRCPHLGRAHRRVENRRDDGPDTIRCRCGDRCASRRMVIEVGALAIEQRVSTVSDRNPPLNPAPAPPCMLSARTWGSNRYRYLIRFQSRITAPGPPRPRRRRACLCRRVIAKLSMLFGEFSLPRGADRSPPSRPCRVPPGVRRFHCQPKTEMCCEMPLPLQSAARLQLGSDAVHL